MNQRKLLTCCLQAFALAAALTLTKMQAADSPDVKQVVARIRSHDFHPTDGGFTKDRTLKTAGVANLSDPDWKVRTLALRDMVRAGEGGFSALIDALADDNVHVRYLATRAFGVQRAGAAVPGLERLLREDPDSTVRSQSAIALSQIGEKSSVAVVRAALEQDEDRDVKLQAEIAIHSLEQGKAATPELAAAFAHLDESDFGLAGVGEKAPDFSLTDTEGKAWKLSDFAGENPVVLVWIFSVWCPVCHGEFNDLMNLRDEFEAAGIKVFTLECHDDFAARVMVGKELAPDQWLSRESFQKGYTERIWWPHLVDRAAAVGVKYDVQPMAFSVHAEYINRPTVAIVDKDGVLRFLYQGTFWGDRPTIHEILEMTKSGQYEYEAPKRLRSKTP